MIDDFDLKLIQELQKNGRKSNVELSRMLGLAEGAIRRRINKLLHKHFIKIVALPNLSALGYSFMSIMGLEVKMADLKKIAKELADKPNVCYLTFVTGRYDLIAIITTQSPKDLSHFIEKEISSIPGILRTETFVNLEIIKGGWTELDTTQLISSLGISLPSSHKE